MSNYVENQTNDNNYDLWMRKLQIVLTAKEPSESGKYMSLIIGDNEETYTSQKGWNPYTESSYTNEYNPSGTNFEISITGTKYNALSKDNGVIEIKNLEYDTLALIMNNKLFKIEILCGYDALNNLQTIVKGEVAFISQKIHSHHDTTTYITYMSEFCAAYSQSRINFKVNSGVNLYSMIDYLFYSQTGSIVKTNLDAALKKDVLLNIYNSYNNSSSIIEEAINQTGATGYIISTDGLTGNVIDITTTANKRWVMLDESGIIIQNGNPTVTSSGLKLTVFPSFAFRVGDILHIDNSIIDVSSGASGSSVSETFNTSYMDDNGDYMITQIDYTLQNRGSSFYLKLTCRALSLIKNLTGSN